MQTNVSIVRKPPSRLRNGYARVAHFTGRMRDHIYHMELILAGMWGGAAWVLPNLRERLLATVKYSNNRFADQAFLVDEVWPLIRDHSCTHDTYYHFNEGCDFPSSYRLPRPIDVGGSVKKMSHWRV